MRGKDIEGDDMLFIGWIDEHYVVAALGRDDAEHAIHEVAMRIEQSNALALLNVLAKQIEEERRFSGPGGADDVGVADAMLGRQPDRFPASGVEV